MITLQQLQHIADEIAETEALLKELREQRADLIAQARVEGETWRAIAAESKMTELGARKTVRAHGFAGAE